MLFRSPICTTFSPLVEQAKHGAEWGMPDWKVAERQKAVKDRTRFEGLVRAAAAGVPIIFGTDAGSPVVPHDAIAGELEFMVEIGVCRDNKAALISITSLSADKNGVLDDRGTLEQGKAADVVVFAGTPLTDLSAVEKVTGVYLDGARVA